MAKADSRSVLADLKAHHKKGAPTDMRRAFERDPQRFTEFSASTDNLLLDYSKCAVNARTMKLLAQLAKVSDVEAKRDAMFAGAAINTTENRAVLHTALRNRANTPVLVNGRDVMPDVNAVLASMVAFAGQVRRSKITDVVTNTGVLETELLRVAVAVESLSDHPLAAAVASGGRERLGEVAPPEASALRSITGRGVTARFATVGGA